MKMALMEAPSEEQPILLSTTLKRQARDWLLEYSRLGPPLLAEPGVGGVRSQDLAASEVVLGPALLISHDCMI